MPFEILHRAFVLFGRRAGIEGAEIAPPAGLRIYFCANRAGICRTAVCGSWRFLRGASLGFAASRILTLIILSEVIGDWGFGVSSQQNG
jgi:hypothetical protein